MDKNILVMVDMQYELTNRSDQLVAKLKRLLSANVFDVVIATEYIGIQDGPVEDVLGYKGPEHDLIMPDLLPYVDETVQKCTFCHFDALKGVLQAHNTDYNVPKQVYIAGMDTDIGVLATVMVLVDNRIRPIVLSDCCRSSGGKDFHEVGLKLIRRYIGDKNIVTAEGLWQSVF